MTRNILLLGGTTEASALAAALAEAAIADVAVRPIPMDMESVFAFLADTRAPAAAGSLEGGES